MVHGDGFPRRVKDTVIQDSERIESAARSAGFAPTDYLGFLQERGLAELRGAEFLLRRAALLLFSKSAQHLDHPNAGIRIFRVEGSERLTGSRNNVSEIKPRIEGNLCHVIEVAYQRLGLLIRNSEHLHDLFFKEMPEYPAFAWQEAVVNAVAHREYRDHGRGVEIWLFSDRMEIRSPGDLLPSVTLEALRARRRAHASRNPRVTRVLAELGLMREQGEGMPRIFDEMETSWLPMPELDLEGGVFVMTLRNTPVFAGGRPEWISFIHRLPLNIRQQRILAKNEGGAFRSCEYQSLNDIDRDQAYRELRSMVDAGFLEAPDHHGPGGMYQVKLALEGPGTMVPPAPMDLRQTFRLRMEAQGFVKNQDYQDCFGVSPTTAKRALAALVKEEILIRAGDSRRYQLGPKWADWSMARH